MKEAYLRGYYGYKNFGDEMILFGIIPYLIKKYKLKKLIIEVGNKKRIQQRIQKNPGLLVHQDIIKFVSTKQHKKKRITHLANMFGFGKYKKLFKFFGGGEVLSDERKFRHDGRNIPLLFNRTIRKRNFVLLGGVGKVNTTRSGILYKYLLPKASEIVTREKTSYDTIKKYTNNVDVHEDFSLEIIKKLSSHGENNHILININKATCTDQNIKKIQNFCKQYPKQKKIYFPCDMIDDLDCFEKIKTAIPQIDIYDWTQHPLEKTIQLFAQTTAGIGSRLHFLLPLKFFQKPLISISNREKVQKMLNN